MFHYMLSGKEVCKQLTKNEGFEIFGLFFLAEMYLKYKYIKNINLQ